MPCRKVKVRPYKRKGKKVKGHRRRIKIRKSGMFNEPEMQEGEDEHSFNVRLKIEEETEPPIEGGDTDYYYNPREAMEVVKKLKKGEKTGEERGLWQGWEDGKHWEVDEE